MLVIGDDHGYPYAGFTGSEIARTPHLDALAASGVVFRRAFTTASTCLPSHRTLLTGLYPQQWYVTVRELHAQGIEPDERSFQQVRHFATLPFLLERAGYTTFQAGKLWEGQDFRDVGFSAGTKETIPLRPNREQVSGGEAGRDFGRDGLEPLWRFLDTRPEGPFLLYLAPTLPHRPFDADAAARAPYADAGLSPQALGYFANVTRLDARVGEILARLEAQGLRERTVVVYLSDNGWHQEPDATDHLAGEGKFGIDEAGFHTPLVVSWPGTIPAGVVRDDLVSTVDLFPTLLELAGAELPPGRLGRSLLPALQEGSPTGREAVFAGIDHVRRAGAAQATLEIVSFARTEDWRYVRNRTRGLDRLFDLAEDPAQERDVADREPAEAEAMRERLDAWLEQVQTPLPLERGGERAALSRSDRTAP